MKTQTLVYGIFLMLLCGFSLLTPVSATSPLHFTYSQTQDHVTKDYMFTITFTGTETIYEVNMTFANQTYVLRQGLQKNEYYMTSPTSLQGLKVDLSVASSLGYTQQSFTVTIGEQSNNIISTPLFNDLLALVGLVLLLGLVSKYVLFYSDTRSKE